MSLTRRMFVKLGLVAPTLLVRPHGPAKTTTEKAKAFPPQTLEEQRELQHALQAGRNSTHFSPP